ncbi:MAG: hypothetical protein QW702_04195 [Candidatus Bathyarchaeia archaeon]
MDKVRHLVLITLGVLLLSIALPFATLVKAQSITMATDKPLYAIKWKNNVIGYVDIVVTVSGLDPETRYSLEVFKFHGPAGLNYAKEIYGATGVTLPFTIPPTMDARPEDIAGTWNATLYKLVGDTKVPVKYVNFGIWAINAKILNYGRILQVWGGSFEPGTKVNFTVYEKMDPTNIITDELFGEDPAKCSVSGVVCVRYGTFSNTSSIITTAIPETTYVVELKEFLLLPTVLSPGTPETKLEFRITHELIVNILKPEDGSKWRRTETVPVEVEVLYQDMVPVTAGTVRVTFTPPKCSPPSPPYDDPKTISLRYSSASRTWVGSFKIERDNATGGDWTPPKNWTVSASASDNYGNSGSDTNEISVRAAILVVESEVAPPASVARATWVSWIIKVTYKGDGSIAKLYLPLCLIYVVNATTKAIVGSAALEEIAVGRYNVTWFVPADAPLGEYMFLIPKNGLYDNITICTIRNVGPEADVYSPAFAVGITKLNVEVKTYGVKFDVTTEKIAFAPGSIVYIGAKVTYADSGVVMTAGYVRAYIYNATGGLVDEIPMAYHGGTRMWWCEWDSDKYPTGRYTVVVKARDPGYNLGEGSTYFYISGLTVSPAKGTVPPIENTKCWNITKAMNEWCVEASIFTDPESGKSLGTKLTIEGVYMTPNSKVNVTIDWLPYPEIAPGEKILLAMNVPTNMEGYFKVEAVFPTTIKGIYKIVARDLKGVVMETTFEVIPGMILTPDPVVGSALIKVIATGLPANITTTGNFDLLVNGLDAMVPLADQLTRWRSDANGTLKSGPKFGTYSVKPGFVIPFTEPGTYVFSLYMNDGKYYNATNVVKFLTAGVSSVSDSVKVVNAFKEFTLIVDKIDELMKILEDMNVVLTSVEENVATLVTDVGTVKTGVSDLAKALSDLNAVITEVKDGIATIKTDVGTVKASVDALKSTLDAVNAKVATVSGDIATIKTDVGSIKAKVDVLDTISSKVDTISGKADTISGKVDSVSDKIDSATSAAKEASGAVSGLSTAVWIAVILSLIAAVASIIAIIQVSRKIAG